MNEKSLLDYGFDAMSSSEVPMTFLDLFKKAIEFSSLSLSESEMKSKMSKFYTQISLDERFLLLADGTWDLRSRHVYEQVNLDDLDIYQDDDDEEVDEEERKLLREELGEVDDEPEEESDDLDFDKPAQDPDDED